MTALPRAKLAMACGFVLLFGVSCLPGVATSSAPDGGPMVLGGGREGVEGVEGTNDDGGAVGQAPENPSGDDGCRVVSCGMANESCCRSSFVSANGTELESYRPRPELVQSVSVDGELTVKFSFFEAGQQGNIIFNLDSQLDMARAEFTGYHEGPVGDFLNVSVWEGALAVGCTDGFALQLRSSNSGSDLLGADIDFSSGVGCIGGGVPGRGSEVVFTAIATGPGDATLTISRVELVPR